MRAAMRAAVCLAREVMPGGGAQEGLAVMDNVPQLAKGIVSRRPKEGAEAILDAHQTEGAIVLQVRPSQTP